MTLGKVKFEHFGKTVYVTFHDFTTGKTYSKFYKSVSSAKGAVTKFEKKLVENYGKNCNGNCL